jgi:hypothetical protein
VRRYILDGRDDAVCSLASWNVDKNHDSWSCQKVLVTRSSVRSYLLPRLAVAPNLTDDACHQQCWYAPEKKRPLRQAEVPVELSPYSCNFRDCCKIECACSYLSRLPSTPNYVVTHGSTRFSLGVLPEDFPYCWQAIATEAGHSGRPPKRRFITTHSNVTHSPSLTESPLSALTNQPRVAEKRDRTRRAERRRLTAVALALGTSASKRTDTDSGFTSSPVF